MKIKSPVTIYVVHHPDCVFAATLANSLYDWFRLGYLSGDQSGAGLPVYYRRHLSGSSLQPEIQFGDAELNVVIALVDHLIVGDAHWRKVIVGLANSIHKIRAGKLPGSYALLLPIAMHESFYRLGPIYQHFNPIRLLDLDRSRIGSILRRAVTEATARMIRSDGDNLPPPLDVFLSHAKRDGREITEHIRDGIRTFGQMRAWYDANDLPYGAAWKSPMELAAKNDTAALVATVTDAYPTRPWCRREATLARTPVKLTGRIGSHVWKVQPAVAIHSPGNNWTRGIPMLESVPHIGWDNSDNDISTELIVDRLALEVMLGLVHRKVALGLARNDKDRQSVCYVTWVPDSWTLASVRQQLGSGVAKIRRIIYPGYGLTAGQIAELAPVISSFNPDTELISFEESMSW